MLASLATPPLPFAPFAPSCSRPQAALRRATARDIADYATAARAAMAREMVELTAEYEHEAEEETRAMLADVLLLDAKP